MVVDSSALMAILLNEPERRAFTEALEGADVRLMSMANWVETSMVIEVRLGTPGLHYLDHLLERAGIETVQVDHAQALEARRAFSRFGKRRHPAGLNFGDCFAYALARVTGQSLLFKGNDFGLTDVSVAVAPITPSPQCN